METPKSRKLRRTKRSSKKKREADIEVVEIPGTIANRVEDGTSSASNITPPRTKLGKFVERKQEEIRSVEWQYYGKYAEADIPVVWGSPLASPTIKPEKNVRDTPTSMHRAQNVTSFSRHCVSDVEEPPQFLNEILALSESIKAQEETRSQSVSADLKNNSDGPSKSESACGNPQILDDSYSNLFDESMNECLVQCSQEFENSCASVLQSVKGDCISDDLENKSNVLKCNVSNISKKKKNSVYNEAKVSSTSGSVFSVKNTLKDNGSLRVGNKNYVNGKRKTNTYVFQGRVLGTKKTLIPECEKHLVNNEKKKRPVLQLCNNIPKSDQISKSANGSSMLDDSLETIKASFFEDDDGDFLSTIPVDLDLVSIPENSGQRKTSEPEIATKNKEKHKNYLNVSSNLDDFTYFEDDVLQLLDSIESNAVPNSSQKLLCTPEEIEKKRQEAKSKLERKKLSLRKNKA